MRGVDPTDSTLWPEFTNVYGKESSSSDTVKVGPQLNRDDHVAYIMATPTEPFSPRARSPEPKPARSSSVC